MKGGSRNALPLRTVPVRRHGDRSFLLSRVTISMLNRHILTTTSAVSAGAVVVWEAQGRLRQWNGELIHWRRENDVVASNGLIGDELQPYLQ